MDDYMFGEKPASGKMITGGKWLMLATQRYRMKMFGVYTQDLLVLFPFI